MNSSNDDHNIPKVPLKNRSHSAYLTLSMPSHMLLLLPGILFQSHSFLETPACFSLKKKKIVVKYTL